MTKIAVLADVYPALFSEDPFKIKCFDNVRAINSEEQELVDQCINRMVQDESELLFVNQPILQNRPKLAENILFDQPYFLNLDTQTFEYRKI